MLSDREIDGLCYEFINQVQNKCDGSFLSLLCVAVDFLEECDEEDSQEARDELIAAKRLALERVCETQRHDMAQEARIDILEVDKLHSIRRLMAGCTRPALVDRCARILMGVLETVVNVADFPYVIQLFPKLAQHSCLSVHRVKFMEKFGAYIDKTTVDGWVMELNWELFPKIQFETQSRMLNHLERMVLNDKKRNAQKKKSWVMGPNGELFPKIPFKTRGQLLNHLKQMVVVKQSKTRHPLASLAKKVLATRIPRLVYHHHAQRQHEQTSLSKREIVAVFRKRLVARCVKRVKGNEEDPVAKLFLETVAKE